MTFLLIFFMSFRQILERIKFFSIVAHRMEIIVNYPCHPCHAYLDGILSLIANGIFFLLFTILFISAILSLI